LNTDSGSGERGKDRETLNGFLFIGAVLRITPVKAQVAVRNRLRFAVYKHTRNPL